MPNATPLRSTARSFALLCFALTAPMSSLGHETMPAGWCQAPGAQPQIVQTFSFNQPQMVALAQQVEQTLGSEGLIAEGLAPREADGRCGIVDRWKMANYIAQNYCAMQTGNATAIANITGPTSFLSANHHSTYTYGGGLQGACAVCKTPKTEE
jgi:hypothetical protein